MTHAIWFSSDWHAGHDNVRHLCARPFSSVDEMNDALVEKHNAVVRDCDIVYQLGDFAWREQLIRPLLQRMRGAATHLVLGNHDQAWPYRKGAAKARERYLRYGFASVDVRGELDVGGIKFLLSHLPYRHPEDTDQRYYEQRPTDRGQWLLCGHVHGRWKTFKRMWNVGVDANGYAPVHIDEILAWARRTA